MNYRILYSCVCHIGNVRSKNQDNIICDETYLDINDKNVDPFLCGVKSSKTPSVFGVFDGLGGEACGDVASYIAAKNAAELKIKKDAVSALTEYCDRTNRDICFYADKNQISAMGTTAAILVFTRKGITLCNIGDSKIFRFCGGVLEQISTDHVMSATYGVKPLLSQKLGVSPAELIIEPYYARMLYNDGDIYLICSDGLTDMLTTAEIERTLAVNSLREACTELLKRALSNGGRDNTTIILCKIERERLF